VIILFWFLVFLLEPQFLILEQLVVSKVQYKLVSYSCINLGCVCFKLYLLIPGNKMIGIYMPMFVTSLLNFIPGYKMFLGIENFSQGRG